jgi:hypothetical protein
MVTESKKARLREQREMGKCEVDDFCAEHGFEKEFITEYHIRIERQVDVFPTNRRYCVLKTKRWGTYNFIKELLKLITKNEEENQN